MLRRKLLCTHSNKLLINFKRKHILLLSSYKKSFVTEMLVVALQIFFTVFEIQKTVSIWPKDSFGGVSEMCSEIADFRILKCQNHLLLISAKFMKYSICGVHLLVNI